MLIRERTLKAAYMRGIGRMEIREAPEPQIQAPDEVKLRVEVVGVCGSDMHYYRTGRIGDQVVQFPWTVGHEFSATVVEAGSAVDNVRVGDRVAVDPLVTCGECDQCLSARLHTCRNQKFMGCPNQLPGAMVEFVVLPARCCYRAPEPMTAVQAGLTEPLAIGIHAQRLAGDVTGKKIAILGSGPIGLSVLVALKSQGPCTVYMTDIRSYRAEIARNFGADWIGNPSEQDIVAEIHRREPHGMDFVYECAGEQETVDQSLELLTPGGTLMLVGIPETDRLSFEMNAMRRKELRVQNVRRQNHCTEAGIEMLQEGKINLDAMVTHHFPLTDSQKAFDIVSNYDDNVVKAMIHLD